MSLYGTRIQYECFHFFENLEENLKFSYNKDDFTDIQKTKKKIDETIKLFDEIWIDMMYEGEYAEYYDRFAKNNNEEELLKESDYVIFSLDEYRILLENGNYRTWVYEKELYDIRNILKEKKKNIVNDINEFNIRAGISLAFIRNYKE